MLKNYLKVSLRNIQRHKTYSAINIAGLALGIACCILILLWVQDELSFDRFHTNAHDIYAATFSNGSTVTPTALGPFLKAEYPEVLHTSRYQGWGRNLLKFENTEVYEPGGVMVDPDFIKMFTIPFVSGDPATALDSPTSILLSKTLAQKLFGGKEPVGQTVRYNTRLDLIISGIFEDYPPNSHIDFEYLLSSNLIKSGNPNFETWEFNNIRTYVQLRKGTQVQEFDAKISDIVEQHRPQDQRPLSLQPILRLHLNPFRHSGGPITYVYIFSFMAFFIMLIACINFINLTTAKSFQRAKEVGIRKTVGASRTHLIRQFYGESFLLTLIALAAGVVVVILCLPMFNQLTAKTFTWQDVGRQSMILGISGLLLLTVLISGSYPALLLSRFQTVKVLKGRFVSGIKGAFFRKALVVVQFSLSVLLILGTVMIFRQVRFLKEYDVGFDRENIVYFGIGGRFRQNIDTIKAELLSNPDIHSITLTDIAPYRWMSNAGVGDVHWEGKTDQQVKMVMTTVDYDYLETFGLEMAEGRFFSEDFSTDATDAYVVNQAAVRAMEMEDPLGKQLRVWDRTGLIIGVLRDYHFESLHDEIIPMAMRIDPNWLLQACVRIAPQRVPETLAFLEQKWKQVSPQYPFEYRFLEDTIHDQYRSEERTGRIVTVFTLLAIVISCLGIFGLSSHTAEQRTKEIGIRKVLGATVASVIRQISREFVMLVVIANVLTWPVSYLLMRLWLQRFAYRSPIDWWPFLVAGGAVLCLSLLTVSWQIIRAATANPADSLRYE